MIIDYSFVLFGFTVTTIIFVSSLYIIIYGLCNKRHANWHNIFGRFITYQNVRRIGLVDGILINLLLVMQYAL